VPTRKPGAKRPAKVSAKSAPSARQRASATASVKAKPAPPAKPKRQHTKPKGAKLTERRRSGTRPKAIAAREIEVAILRLKRDECLTVREIADRLGIGKSTVHERLKSALDEMEEVASEERERLRRIEYARLEHYTAQLSTKIERGNMKAIDRAIKLSQRRSALLGLDAPSQSRVGGAGDAAANGVSMVDVLRDIFGLAPDATPEPIEGDDDL
jgi:predicted DNA-binding protein (UPF0251 family)